MAAFWADMCLTFDGTSSLPIRTSDSMHEPLVAQPAGNDVDNSTDGKNKTHIVAK